MSEWISAHPGTIGALAVGWIIAIAFAALWLHAERWSDKHFGLWRDETRARERAEAEVRAVRAQAVTLWVCPDCGFAFDAIHTQEGTMPECYACPACFEDRGNQLLKRLLRTPNRALKPWTAKKIAREILAEKRYPKERAS